MACMFGVMQVVCIVNDTLDVALIVANIQSCLKDVFLLFHNLFFFRILLGLLGLLALYAPLA